MRLGIVTDVHLSPPGAPPAAWHNPYDLDGAPRRLALALERLGAEGVEAVAVLGDLTGAADAGSVERGLDLLATADVPVRIVPGNHDTEEGGVDLAAAVDRFGAARVRLAAPAGEEIGGGRVAGVGIGRSGDGRWAMGPVETGAWGAAPVVLLSHSPVLDREPAVEAAGLRNAGTFADPTGIGPALAERPAPTVVLHGHFHVRDAAVEGAVLQIGFAALVEPPNEVGVLDVEAGTGDALAVRVRRLPVDPVAAERLPVLVPERQAWRFAAGAWREVSDVDGG